MKARLALLADTRPCSNTSRHPTHAFGVAYVRISSDPAVDIFEKIGYIGDVWDRAGPGTTWQAYTVGQGESKAVAADTHALECT